MDNEQLALYKNEAKDMTQFESNASLASIFGLSEEDVAKMDETKDFTPFYSFKRDGVFKAGVSEKFEILTPPLKEVIKQGEEPKRVIYLKCLTDSIRYKMSLSNSLSREFCFLAKKIGTDFIGAKIVISTVDVVSKTKGKITVYRIQLL